MDITNMIYFCTVCKYMNITKAAEYLHISQSALSRRIVALEDELGVQLLNRSGGYFELTLAGKAFWEEAEDIIRRHGKLVSRIEKYKYDGSMRIGFSQIMYLNPFIDFVSEAKKRNPETGIFFKENAIVKNVNELRSENLDIIYTTRGEVDGLPGISYIVLAENDLTFLVPKGHRLWNKRSISNEDIGGETICVIKDSSHSALTASKSVDALEKMGMPLNSIENVYYCDSSIEVMMYVYTSGCLGMGCTLQSAEYSLHPDKIRSIRLEYPHINYGDLVLAYRSGDMRVETFIKSAL